MPEGAKAPGETFADFQRVFPDEASCVRHLFAARYGDGTRCPRCGRSAKWRQKSSRRSFRSICCRDELSPTVGTFLSHSRVPLRTSLYAVLLTAIFDGRLSSIFLAKQTGLGRPAAWALSDRIRVQMALLALRAAAPYSGKVFVDEMLLKTVRRRSGARSDPAIIFGITDGVRPSFFCVPDRKGDTLAGVIASVVTPGTTIVCDGYASYDRLAKRGYGLSRVIHSRGLWKNVHGDTTAPIEQLWTGVRRRLERVHQQVAREHLWKYLGQFAFIAHCRKLGISPFWTTISAFPDVSPRSLARAEATIDRVGWTSTMIEG